jgi:5-methylcytosine-specific restriction endonuclease McrA
VDHVIPLSEGGGDDDNNRTVACRGCNLALDMAHQKQRKSGKRGSRGFNANKAIIRALEKPNTALEIK